jgi:hypothetical protein
MPGRSKIAGALLAIAGASLYFVDLSHHTNLHFVIPGFLMMGIGAVFTMFGTMDSE